MKLLHKNVFHLEKTVSEKSNVFFCSLYKIISPVQCLCSRIMALLRRCIGFSATDMLWLSRRQSTGFLVDLLSVGNHFGAPQFNIQDDSNILKISIHVSLFAIAVSEYLVPISTKCNTQYLESFIRVNENSASCASLNAFGVFAIDTFRELSGCSP